ncbi:hypothetical protein [Noviherbaspirillum humi]|nr:hypothetical protein [Noviherbaspirillum humi]
MSQTVKIPSDISPRGARLARSHTASGGMQELKLPELAGLAFAPLVRYLHNWWMQRAERHYLICADVELQRAREAQQNVAYYQKRAALARAARH